MMLTPHAPSARIPSRRGAGWILWAAFVGCSACGVGIAEDPRYSGLDVQFRGHREIQRTGSGQWEPLVTETTSRIGACVTAQSVVDTSRWQARWTIDAGMSSQYFPPVRRLKNTLCFEQPLPPGVASGAHRLCPELRDAFDGVSTRIACLPFHLPAEPERFKKLSDALDGAYAAKSSLAHEPYIERLEAVSRDALAAGFPLLATRAQLMAVHALRGRGTIGDWKSVDRLLGGKPAFLGAPAALRMAGEYDLASAISRCDRNMDLRTAWQDLSDASLEFQRSLSDSWPVPRVRQADLIASAGSPGEARMRLVELSEECRTYGCEPRMLNTVLGTHAWHTLLDFDASEADLAQAQAELTETIDHSQPKEDALVLANRWVNLAFAKFRTGSDARPALEQVRLLLSAEDTAGSGRAGLYAAWARIIGGLDALRRGDPREALSACRQPPHISDWPQLAAQSLSCRARAHSRTGDRAEARREIDRALAIHAELSGATIGQTISLGPGQRAEDFYFAAGLAIEDGDPASAWQTLQDLDTLSGLEDNRARCRTSSGEDREHEQARLGVMLDALSGPAPLDRIAQREGVAQSLRVRLQELVRLSNLCGQDPLASAEARDPHEAREAPEPPEASAFALEDALVSLWRVPSDGTIRVQKVPLAPRERIRRLDALESAVQRSISTREWDELASPFARALIPAGRDPAPPVRIALYGSMQRVPLPALPFPEPSSAPASSVDEPDGKSREISRWGAKTTIVVVPSRVGSEPPTAKRAGPGDQREPAPIFIVDPTGNLAAGRALASMYRRLFPEATILEGASATREAVTKALRQPARWVHFDGHGRFDPAFSELSSIQLSDGELRAAEVARDVTARELVNLSGCQTGRSQVTADSGQFGPARMLLNHGARWVVASRTDLPDDVALAFNTAFYEALHAGAGPQEAFRAAVSSMARTRPPSAWAGLLLLGHP